MYIKKKLNNFQKRFLFSKDFLIVFGFHWFFLQLLLQQLYGYIYIYKLYIYIRFFI